MVGRIADGTGTKRRSDRKKNRQATERYERAAKSAMEVVMKISDDLMRDFCRAPDRCVMHDGKGRKDRADSVPRHSGAVDQRRSSEGASGAAW